MGEGRQTLPQLIFVFLDSREVLPMYLIFSMEGWEGIHSDP